jgi:cytochrome c peroxidase
MKMHRIGDDIEFENGWDTPTLIEVWRTAPYLFDGRAATMEDVFKVHRHGLYSEVSNREIEELVEYVNSL